MLGRFHHLREQVACSAQRRLPASAADGDDDISEAQVDGAAASDGAAGDNVKGDSLIEALGYGDVGSDIDVHYELAAIRRMRLEFFC